MTIVHEELREIKDLTFRIRHYYDEDPDLSWMGEWAGDPEGDYYVDRREGLLYGEHQEATRTLPLYLHGDLRITDTLDALPSPYDNVALDDYTRRLFEWKWEVQEYDYFDENMTTLDVDDEDAMQKAVWVSLYMAGREVLADNLSARDGWNEYRYWIPGSNHLPHNPKNWGHVDLGVGPGTEHWNTRKWKYHGVTPDLDLHTPEFWLDVSYACDDYERMQAYAREDWYMIGVEAALLDDDGEVWEREAVWGIESDSDEYEKSHGGSPYIPSVENDMISRVLHNLPQVEEKLQRKIDRVKAYLEKVRTQKEKV